MAAVQHFCFNEGRMSRLPSFKLLATALTCVSAVGACGGNTESDPPDDANSGGTGVVTDAGGGPSGGGSGNATDSGGSGSADGGAGAAGGVGGTGGVDVAAGGSDPQCLLCGPPALCGESCENACGCCCSDGEITVGDDEISRVCRDGCLVDPPETIDPWTSFTSTSGNGLCPPEFPCTLFYQLLPSKELTKTDGDAIELFTMGSSDFAIIDAYLRDTEFRALMQNGFACGPPPTDVGASFSLETEGGEEWTQGVTGCAYGGGGDDAAAVELIRDILDHY